MSQPLALAADPGMAARLKWLVADSAVLARRNLSHVRQIPEKLIDVTLQPLMFVLLFAYVFGGVIHVPGGSYREYLVGGILVQTIAFGMVGPATAIATDMREGIIDRFRSLPMSRSAYLVGHLIAELTAAALGIVVLTGSGLIVGWRIHTDVLHAAAAFGLLLLFASAVLWLGTLIGLLARSADAVTGVVFMVIFPLTFLSSAFVPLAGLPAGLQTVGEYNPISSMIAAVRTLFGNPTALPIDAPWPLEHPIVSALVWCIILLGITAPLAVWRYRVRTAD